MLIFVPHFTSYNFYPNRPKIKLFFPKRYKIFEGWGLRPQTPLNTPQVQISGYAPNQKYAKQVCARSRTLIINILNFEIMHNLRL